VELKRKRMQRGDSEYGGMTDWRMAKKEKTLRPTKTSTSKERKGSVQERVHSTTKQL